MICRVCKCAMTVDPLIRDTHMCVYYRELATFTFYMCACMYTHPYVLVLYIYIYIYIYIYVRCTMYDVQCTTLHRGLYTLNILVENVLCTWYIVAATTNHRSPTVRCRLDY